MDKEMLQLSARFGTPFYLFDCDAFRNRLERIRQSFAPAEICYCVKTNPFLVPQVRSLVSRLEVCSYGEFMLCRSCDIPMGYIFYTGVQKSEPEIRSAIEYGVRTFSCESLHQLELLSQAARSTGVTIDVLLRLGSNTQFGMDEQDIRQIGSLPPPEGLNMVGIHYFERSQKRDASKVRQELSYLSAFCREMEQMYGFRVQQLEYGAGLDVDYFASDPAAADRILLEEAAPIIREFACQFRLTVEMGRFFAAPCGYYVTSVVDIKRVGGVDYAIVDGGSHQMHYDGQMMGMKLPPMRVLRTEDPVVNPTGKDRKWSVCGSLCTHNDLITRQFPAAALQIGDRICFSYIGAYSVTEGMAAFLTRDIPPVILYSSAEGAVCTRERMNTLFLNCPKV